MTVTMATANRNLDTFILIWSITQLGEHKYVININVFPSFGLIKHYQLIQNSNISVDSTR